MSPYKPCNKEKRKRQIGRETETERQRDIERERETERASENVSERGR